MDRTCPFCDYSERETVVYEDSLCFACISKDPISPFHTLVIPRPHFEKLTDLPDLVATELVLALKRVSERVARVTGADWIMHLSEDDLKNVGVNEVAHFKFHIIPRSEGDGVVTDWNRREGQGNDRRYQQAAFLRAEIRGPLPLP